MARQAGLRCRVIDYAAARRMGMGGLVSVGQGSATKPCLIILEHRPARIAASARGTRLALVGKTITFDTGGYSLKVNNGMKGMKYDKCGGMAVLGAMRAVAALRLPVHVFGVLPAAENMVAGDAYRPDDIITMLNGVTVEVTNTDAEGRLVLADALAYTCRTLKATAVVDMATLTGGVVVALGSWCAGLWCDDAGLRKRLDAAAASSGERLWPLPLWKEHRDFMRAKHADLWNSAPKRDGHPIQGAAFLSYFVTEGVPWAHIDIAGTSNVESDKDLHVIGPTGYGVRLLAELAGGYAAPA
jgi:leucyl aminopeptidase